MAETNDWKSSSSRQKVIEYIDSTTSNLPQNFKAINSTELENQLFARSENQADYFQKVNNLIKNISQAKSNANAYMQQQQQQQQINNQQLNINQASMMLNRTNNNTPMHRQQQNGLQNHTLQQHNQFATNALQQQTNSMQQNNITNTLQTNQLTSNTLQQQQNLQNNNNPINQQMKQQQQNQLNNNLIQQMGPNMLAQNQQGQIILNQNNVSQSGQQQLSQNVMLQQAGVMQGGNLQMMNSLQQGNNLQLGPTSIQHPINNMGGQGQTMVRAPMNPQQMSAMQQQPNRSAFPTYSPHQVTARHIMPQNRLQILQQSGLAMNQQQMHQNQQQLTMIMANQQNNQMMPANQFTMMNHATQIARNQQAFNQGAGVSSVSLTSPGGAGGLMINSPASNQQIPASPARMPMPSPGSSSLTNQGNVQMSQAEEQEYLQKWSQLQKYIEPLKRMIQQIDKDEDRKVDLNKMKNLLDILSDKTKRLPIQTLLKCEQVLEKQVDVNKPHIIPQSATPENFGDSLLEALEANLKSSNFNHILNKTFAPAAQLIQSPNTPKKAKLAFDALKPEVTSFEVSNLIQGEVARLNPRFSVSIHPTLHRTASEVIILECTIDDSNLPNVPPIVIILPSSYPSKSPTFEMPTEQYDSTEFFSKIKENLLKETGKITGNYSLTALLNYWDLSIRKSCRNTQQFL